MNTCTRRRVSCTPWQPAAPAEVGQARHRPGRAVVHELQTARRAALALHHALQDQDVDDAPFGEALAGNDYRWLHGVFNEHLGEPTLRPALHAAGAAPQCRVGGYSGSACMHGKQRHVDLFERTPPLSSLSHCLQACPALHIHTAAGLGCDSVWSCDALARPSACLQARSGSEEFARVLWQWRSRCQHWARAAMRRTRHRCNRSNSVLLVGHVQSRDLISSCDINKHFS